MREPRDLSARIVLVDDVALRGLHQFRFRARHRLQRRLAVAAFDRLFDDANRAAHLGTTGLVDNGAAGNLARRLLGGGGIGHAFKYPSTVTNRGCSGLSAPPVQPRDRRWYVSGCSTRMPFSEHRSLSRRRRSKNSGGRIASAAIGGLIEGANCSVNAFRGPKARKARRKALIDADEVEFPALCHKWLTAFSGARDIR